MMKRGILFVLLGLSILTWASAREHDRRGSPPVIVAEAVTVTGNLTIAQGLLAVKSGDITYLIPGLLRYTGFIDSLKDGAKVILEGSAIANPQDAKTKTLFVTKMTLGGKDYDLSRPSGAPMGHPQGRW